MRAETGVNSVTAKTPMNTATVKGGSRKSQADTPAARVATSSRERERRTKVKTPPSRMAKGSILAQVRQLQQRHADGGGSGDVVSGGAVQKVHDIDGES